MASGWRAIPVLRLRPLRRTRDRTQQQNRLAPFRSMLFKKEKDHEISHPNGRNAVHFAAPD